METAAEALGVAAPMVVAAEAEGEALRLAASELVQALGVAATVVVAVEA